MSLNIFRDFGLTPREHYYHRFFNDAMRDFANPFAMMPYWLDQPTVEHCNIGNTIGKVVDDKDKFAVEINVSQFSPEELSVNLKDRNLVIEGHHEERSDVHGSIERHFIRKYRLPDDASLDEIASTLSREGVLAVTAPKKTTEAGRSIPIKATPKEAVTAKKK